MYHQHIAWWRRRRVIEHLTGTPREQPVADPTDAADPRLSVIGALRQLTPKQRVVIVLRYYDDLTEAQAADVLGCRFGTLKGR